MNYEEQQKIIVYEYDSKGFYLSPRENIVGEEMLSNTTTKFPFVEKLVKPLWDNELDVWVEGESQEEKEGREALERLNALQPSSEEVENSELEIKVLTLLMEMGVI